MGVKLGLTTPDSRGNFTYSVLEVSKKVWSANSGSGTDTFCAKDVVIPNSMNNIVKIDFLI